MAVFTRRRFSERKSYATAVKSTVVSFEQPSQFSPDPLTEAIQAEVYGFITDQAHRLDAEGCQRLVRHGFLPKREVMSGGGKVPLQVPRVRDRSMTSDVDERCV